MFTKILSIAGAVSVLAAFIGLINGVFGTHIGIGTRSSSVNTGGIPGDPVVVGFFFIAGALCLVAAYFINKRQTRAARIN